MLSLSSFAAGWKGLWALNASNGAILWTVYRPVHALSFYYNSPVIDDANRVYIGTDSGECTLCHYLQLEERVHQHRQR